jgi:hypothetical protein
MGSIRISLVMRTLFSNALGSLNLTTLAGISTFLTVLLKIIEAGTDYWNRVGKQRRSAWLRAEIKSLQEFQQNVPPAVREILERQLESLYGQYEGLWTPVENRPLRAPQVSLLRRVFLLYIPVRSRAMIVHVLLWLYLYVIIAPGRGGQRTTDEIAGTLFFLPLVWAFLYIWATRAERPRKQRTPLQTVFLVYKHGGASAFMFTGLYYLSAYIFLRTFLTGWVRQDYNTEVMMRALVAALVCHDFVRSLDT